MALSSVNEKGQTTPEISDNEETHGDITVIKT